MVRCLMYVWEVYARACLYVFTVSGYALVYWFRRGSVEEMRCGSSSRDGEEGVEVVVIWGVSVGEE